MPENQLNASFKLNKKELDTLVDWIFFQEDLSEREIDFANKICAGQNILKQKNRFNCFYLNLDECDIARYWYENLLECLIDKSDADLHIAINIFLEEYESDAEN